MRNKIDDDIGALCLRTGLSQDSYCSFLAGEEDVATVPSERLYLPRSGSSTSSAHALPSAPLRWRALRGLLKATQALSTGSPGRLPVGSLSFIPCGGGVGTTTLLATLGRALALRNERVFLIDGVAGSLLPFYFGGQREATGWCSFASGLSDSDGGISVLARGAATPAAFAQMLQTVAEAGGDRVLTDAWVDLPPESRMKLLQETTCIAVLTPDLRSLLRLQQIEHELKEVDRDAPRRLQVLLTRFDSSLPMHVELRRSLSLALGDRMLPFHLRRSDEPAMALAEGHTVLDYAPASGIAEDYEVLTHWVQARPRFSGSLRAASDVPVAR